MISSLKQEGIDYLFLGDELGGRPKNPDLYIDGMVSYSLIKETNLFQSGINKVIKLAGSGIKGTLMCSESDQDKCHRKHLIADELISKGVSVIHIDKSGTLCQHQVNQLLF